MRREMIPAYLVLEWINDAVRSADSRMPWEDRKAISVFTNTQFSGSWPKSRRMLETKLRHIRTFLLSEWVRMGIKAKPHPTG